MPQEDTGVSGRPYKSIVIGAPVEKTPRRQPVRGLLSGLGAVRDGVNHRAGGGRGHRVSGRERRISSGRRSTALTPWLGMMGNPNLRSHFRAVDYALPP